MSEEEHTKFLSWYEELKKKNYVFNFQNKIKHFCKADVTILRLACLETTRVWKKILRLW